MARKNALIRKYINLTVKEDTAILDQPIYLFQNDRNIDLVFTIKNLRYDIVRNVVQEENIVESSGATYFRVKILKPDQDDKDKEFTSDLYLVNGENQVVFNINDTFIFDGKDEDGNLPSEENDKIGIYKLQIQLYDTALGRITIPEVEFAVLSPIFYDPETDGVIVDDSTVGDSVLGQPDEITGFYEWYKGQIVSAERLNAIQDKIKELQIEINNIDVGKVTAKEVSYESNEFTNVQDALDSLLYKSPTVTSLTTTYSGGTTLEMGTVLASVTFNWTYNKDITSQAFANVNLDPSIRTYTYNRGIFNTTTLSLTASDGKNSCSKSITFTYANRIFYGVSSTNTYNVALLKSLSNTLSNSKARSFTVNAGSNQYIFYAVPTRLGGCKFAVHGFEGGFEKVATISYTNSQSYTESYDIYKSDNPNLGNTTVVVS